MTATVERSAGDDPTAGLVERLLAGSGGEIGRAQVGAELAGLLAGDRGATFWEQLVEAVESLDAAAAIEPATIVRRLLHGGALRLSLAREQFRSARGAAGSASDTWAGLGHALDAVLATALHPAQLVLRRLAATDSEHVLEQVRAGDVVHPPANLHDVASRLGPGREIFVFTTPTEPDELLAFVEVALGRGVPGSIHDILAGTQESPVAPDTATFYSINSTRPLLRGTPFGPHLIARTAAALAALYPTLSRWVTLSPAPNLARWLTENEPALDEQLSRLRVADGRSPSELDHALTQAATRYLFATSPGGRRLVDPVARFHLGNGALLWRINVGAHRADYGWHESRGVMVNYLYELDLAGARAEAAAAGNPAAAPSLRPPPPQ